MKEQVQVAWGEKLLVFRQKGGYRQGELADALSFIRLPPELSDSTSPIGDNIIVQNYELSRFEQGHRCPRPRRRHLALIYGLVHLGCIESIEEDAFPDTPMLVTCRVLSYRTFQEYLAACHLSTQRDFVQQAQALAAKHQSWHEVILLAVGYLVHCSDTIERPLLFIGELCPEQAPALNEELAWQKIWLAGKAFVEIGIERTEALQHGRALIERLRSHLTTLITHDLHVCHWLSTSWGDRNATARLRRDGGQCSTQRDRPDCQRCLDW